MRAALVAEQTLNNSEMYNDNTIGVYLRRRRLSVGTNPASPDRRAVYAARVLREPVFYPH